MKSNTNDLHRKYKERAMESLKKALEKGEVDEPIIPYLEVINSYEEFYTTSSCYGRITVDDTPLIENKREHDWLGKWHRTVRVEEVERAINARKKDVVWIKQDPFILHIGARDFEAAEKLLYAARELTGLKRAGIMHTSPRIMIEVMGLDFMACPVVIKGIRVIENLEKVVEIANMKFKRNEERLRRFINNLKSVMER